MFSYFFHLVLTLETSEMSAIFKKELLALAKSIYLRIMIMITTMKAKVVMIMVVMMMMMMIKANLR